MCEKCKKKKEEEEKKEDLVFIDSTGGTKLCPKCKHVMPYYIYLCERCGYAWD